MGAVTVGLKAPGFTRAGANLDREVTVPAGGSVSLSVVGAVSTATLPDSAESYRRVRRAGARRGRPHRHHRLQPPLGRGHPLHRRPRPGLEKAIVYRWWGERYNSLDANAPGYVYQYPTTIEG